MKFSDVMKETSFVLIVTPFILIGWLVVFIQCALADWSIAAGIFTVLFWGVLIFLWWNWADNKFGGKDE